MTFDEAAVRARLERYDKAKQMWLVACREHKRVRPDTTKMPENAEQECALKKVQHLNGLQMNVRDYVHDHAESDLRAALAEIERIRSGLSESVKLQSHYAALLNQYDGGNRSGFPTADAWLARLGELAERDVAQSEDPIPKNREVDNDRRIS